MSKQILIAGGTGLIGSAIHRQARASGFQVTNLSRSPGPDTIVWDPVKGSIQLSSKMKFDAIINLAGSLLSERRWTEARKKEIYQSRMQSTRTLQNYLYDGRLQTGFYLGMSALGIYGDRGDALVTEETPIRNTDDWFIQTVAQWEKEHRQIADLEIRTVILRTGLVLSNQGGALKEILDKSRIGILPIFGNGKQIWSWIHIDDLALLMLYFMDQPKAVGVYLGTASNPVTNKEFIRTLNRVSKHKRPIAPVPRIALSLVLGEMHRVVYESCNAVSIRLPETGFHFKYNQIEEALAHLMGRKQ
jgi:uncharacterized protein (TIGR01777 family)